MSWLCWGKFSYYHDQDLLPLHGSACTIKSTMISGRLWITRPTTHSGMESTGISTNTTAQEGGDLSDEVQPQEEPPDWQSVQEGRRTSLCSTLLQLPQGPQLASQQGCYATSSCHHNHTIICIACQFKIKNPVHNHALLFSNLDKHNVAFAPY
jgi:hypothetical protein